MTLYDVRLFVKTDITHMGQTDLNH